MNYVVRKHSYLATEYMITILSFTRNQEQQNIFFLEKTLNYQKNLVQYYSLLNDLVPAFAKKLKESDMGESSVINLIIAKCLNQIGMPNLQTTQHQVAILNLVTDIWLHFATYLDKFPALPEKFYNLLK